MSNVCRICNLSDQRHLIVKNVGQNKFVMCSTCITKYNIHSTPELNKLFKYQCIKCEDKFKSFTRRYSLNQHLKLIHNRVLLDCELCGWTTPYQNSLKKHYRSIHEICSVQTEKNKSIRKSKPKPQPVYNFDYVDDSPKIKPRQLYDKLTNTYYSPP